MTNVHDIQLNVENLNTEVVDGFISRRPHPDNESFWIYNYTPKAQYERHWSNETLSCRGLILDESVTPFKVVARPFKKFFNLGEVEMPEGLFVAQEKMDGSLGIVYRLPGELPAVATRGSFTSAQAIWATKKLRSNEKLLATANEIIDADFTVLVEIIYPENRIVLDYGNREVLVGLTAIHNRTGSDTYLEELGWPEPIAPFYADFSIEIMNRQVEDGMADNREGVVLRWNDGTRLKVKFEEYVRLHKIVTRVTERSIWEMLSNGHPIASLAEYVPDEFYEWMNSVATGLFEQFSAVEKEALSSLDQVDRSASRKDQASSILERPHCGIVFKMLDGKAYTDQIWALIKPSAERSFETV